jgi:hypothetical protein
MSPKTIKPQAIAKPIRPRSQAARQNFQSLPCLALTQLLQLASRD